MFGVECLLLWWVGLCVICIGLGLEGGSFFIVSVLVGHSGIVGKMLGFIGRRWLVGVSLW